MPRRIKLTFYPIAILGRAWSIASALRPIVTDHADGEILAGFGSTVTRLTVEAVPAAIQVVC